MYVFFKCDTSRQLGKEANGLLGVFRNQLLVLILSLLSIVGGKGYAQEVVKERIQLPIITQKFLPYLQLGGSKFSGNSESRWAHGIDMFVPLWQRSTNDLVFSHIRLYDRSGAPFEGNIHFGYRNLSESKNRILGIHVAYDHKRVDHSNNHFKQLAFGTSMWFGPLFVGANYYQPVGKTTIPVNETFDLVFEDYKTPYENLFLYNVNELGVTAKKKAAGGFDFEFGYELSDGLVLYTGGYHFKTKGAKAICGPKLSLNYDYARKDNRPLLGILNSLGVGAEIQHDNVRGTIVHFDLRMKFGLSTAKSNLSTLSKHMVDLVRRDVDIVALNEVTTFARPHLHPDSKKETVAIVPLPSANDNLLPNLDAELLEDKHLIVAIPSQLKNSAPIKKKVEDWAKQLKKKALAVEFISVDKSFVPINRSSKNLDPIDQHSKLIIESAGKIVIDSLMNAAKQKGVLDISEQTFKDKVLEGMWNGTLNVDALFEFARTATCGAASIVAGVFTANPLVTTAVLHACNFGLRMAKGYFYDGKGFFQTVSDAFFDTIPFFATSATTELVTNLVINLLFPGVKFGKFAKAMIDSAAYSAQSLLTTAITGYIRNTSADLIFGKDEKNDRNFIKDFIKESIIPEWKYTVSGMFAESINNVIWNKSVYAIGPMIGYAIEGALIGALTGGYEYIQPYIRRAYYTEVVRATLPFKSALEECYQTHKNLELCKSGKNGVPKNVESGEGWGIIDQITVDELGAITVIPIDAHGIESTDTYILTPTISGNGLLIWKKSGGGVDAGDVK